MIQKTCVICSQTYTGLAKFVCSRKCMAIRQYKRIKKDCFHCKTEIEVPPNKLRNKNYCSNGCRLNASRVPLLTKQCRGCKKAFKQKRRGRQGKNERLCSNTCKKLIWSWKYDQCIECGKTDKPHGGNGYCSRCSKKRYNKTPRRREKRKTYLRRYFKTPKGRAISSNQKHLRRSLYKETDITATWLLELKTKAVFCPLCSVEMVEDGRMLDGKTLDHIILLSLEGTHTMANVRITCRTCNLSRPRDGRDITLPTMGL